jgi:hypothetical protein
VPHRWSAEKTRPPARSLCIISRSAIIGDRAEDVHLQLAGGRGGVDPFGQADERYAETLQLVDQRDHVFEAPSKSIESPADQHIEPPTLGVHNELVECGATIPGPTHAAIDVLDRGPAARLDITSEFPQLVLRLLVEGAHPRIDRGLHASTALLVVPRSVKADCGRSANDVVFVVMVFLE